jgi:hypothetical protein
MTIRLVSHKYNLNGDYTPDGKVTGTFYKFVEPRTEAEYYIPEAEVAGMKSMSKNADYISINEANVHSDGSIGIIVNDVTMKHNMRDGSYIPGGAQEGSFYKVKIDHPQAGPQEIYVPVNDSGDSAVAALKGVIGGSRRRKFRGTKKMRKSRRGPKKSRRSLY